MSSVYSGSSISSALQNFLVTVERLLSLTTITPATSTASLGVKGGGTRSAVRSDILGPLLVFILVWILPSYITAILLSATIYGHETVRLQPRRWLGRISESILQSLKIHYRTVDIIQTSQC